MTAVRKRVLEILSQTPSASLKELCYYAGTTRQTLNKMEKEGLLTYYGRQIFRSPLRRAAGDVTGGNTFRRAAFPLPAAGI